MARLAEADGIEVIACTPHIMPGVYENDGNRIRSAVRQFTESLRESGIDLRLVCGADVHVTPELVFGLRDGRLPTLDETRYFLLEPPHHVLTPRFVEFTQSLIAAEYVPILTHPERLSWIDGHYDVITRLVEAGVLMQLTAGSVTGRFGSRARYWAERMLDEGRVHLLATDAHDDRRRPPLLSEARAAASARVGEAAASRLVLENPLNILRNVLRLKILPRSEESADAQAADRDDSKRKFRRWAWRLRKRLAGVR